VIDSVREEVLGLRDEMWPAKRPGELLETVRSIEALKSSLEAIELSVIAEVAATDAAKAEEWASAKDFITSASGGTKASGPGAVRLARALTTDCTATHDALADGWLSRDQARVIVRTIDALPVKRTLREQAELLLLEAARFKDASELAEWARGMIERLDPDGDDRREERQLDKLERAAHLHRFFAISPDGAGGVRIKGRTTTEDAAVIKAALMALSGPHPTTQPGACGGEHACTDPMCTHDGRDPRDHGVRFLDALVEGCQLLLDTRVLPESHGAKPHLNLTMNYHDLLNGIGVGTLETGETLSAAAVRRLACDAQITALVLGANSEILDVARTQRLVTTAIWQALVVRDRHCAFPGCRRPPIACDAHHLVAWLDGGETSLDNLCLLCRAHHTIVHNTPWQIRLNPIDRRPEFLPPASRGQDRKWIRDRSARE
jgi:hypothetical protein